MAFTIKATPPVYASLQDDLVYTVDYPEHTSDSVTYPNYKFIGDVYVGATLVARKKIIKDPVTGIGIFNIGQVVRNYLTTIFNPTANVIVAQQMGDGEFNLTVTMKFGEEYNFTSYIDLVVDAPRVYFNNYNGRLKGGVSSIVPMVNNPATNLMYLQRRKVLLTSPYVFLPYFAYSGGTPIFQVGPHGAGVPYGTSLSPTALGMVTLNVSPVAINAVAPGTINASTQYYIVNVNGQLITYDIICEPLYRVYPIHFLNQYGGFETVLFTKVSRKSFDITRKDFGKLPYVVDGAGAVTYKNSNGVYNESRSVYSSQFKEKLTLNSDLLTDAEYEWLADLILSTMVYVEDSGYLFPAVITENNYEPKKAINDSLTNLTISIEYGNQLNAQYR